MRKFALLLLLAGSAVPAIAAADGPRGDNDGARAERSERPARAERAQRSDGAQRAERAQRPERAQQSERMMSRERAFEQRRSAAAPLEAGTRSVAPNEGVRRSMRERVQVRDQVEAPVATRTFEGRRDGRRSRDSATTGWQPRDREVRSIPNTTPTVTTSGRRDRDGVSRHSGNYNRWTQNWRHDRRYDWRNHRNRNRTTFHLGFYYDPFGYSYRRYSIGSRLYPNYYQSSFWINDPWQYRLPPAYGPYRWVRYHNDALLIDTWSGEVVDVIYGFFW